MGLSIAPQKQIILLIILQKIVVTQTILGTKNVNLAMNYQEKFIVERRLLQTTYLMSNLWVT